MHSIRLWFVAWLLAGLGILIAGCTPIRPAAGTLPAAAAPSSANRLLTIGLDGNLYTLNPNGGDRLALTGDASTRIAYTQPTWSPDGRDIAFSRIEAFGSTVRSSLHVVSADGRARARVEAPFPPFYIYWSPTGEQLAFLSNWLRGDDPSLALRVVDLGADETGNLEMKLRTLAQGQPLYFSWAPDGSSLLTHIGNERVELQSTDGSQAALAPAAVGFAAPQWAGDGQSHVYAVLDDGGRRRLVVAALDGAIVQEITDYAALISFSLSPAATQLAYVVTDDPLAGTLGPLYLMELADNSTRQISAEPVLAFFWSPDSQKLAYAVAETERGALRLRWHVWDGERRTAYSAFRPSRTYLQSYLLFFDQYAQSIRFWAPDSTAFTYAGAAADGSGRIGIWVQQLGEGRQPVRVSDGYFSAWSPQ